MANLFKQLNKLKTNIFGGPGNTGFTKPPASRVQDINMLENTPTDTLFQDPLSVSTFSYPMDVQQNFQNGHYMLFYVNVQEKTKYDYGKEDSVFVGDEVSYYASTHKLGRTSVTIDVHVFAQRQFAEDGDFIAVTEARAVMVAVDDNNKPTALNK